MVDYSIETFTKGGVMKIQVNPHIMRLLRGLAVVGGMFGVVFGVVGWVLLTREHPSIGAVIAVLFVSYLIGLGLDRGRGSR